MTDHGHGHGHGDGHGRGARRRTAPSRGRRAAGALLVAGALALTACSSDAGVVSGKDVGTAPASTSAVSSPTSPATTAAPSSTSAAPSRSTGAPPSTSSAPASSPPPAAAGPHTLCASDTSPNAIAQCLRAALSTFWSGELNQVVGEPVHLDAPASSVPAQCRPGITGGPAFTCRENLSLYVNRGLLDLIAKYFPGGQRFYAFAVVQGHEIGHVLQYTLHQPQIENGGGSDSAIRFVEQQADCLSGVWAAHASRQFDTATFRRVAARLLTLISSNSEISTHGTPAQRSAAIERGLTSGRPQSCKLVTFH